jgi:hypothetical protein
MTRERRLSSFVCPHPRNVQEKENIEDRIANIYFNRFLEATSQWRINIELLFLGKNLEKHTFLIRRGHI